MEVPELRAKWEHLHHNLQTSSHNYLRITRMMKYLELFQLHELQLNILSCFLRQIYCHGRYSKCVSALHGFWVLTLRSIETFSAMTAV